MRNLVKRLGALLVAATLQAGGARAALVAVDSEYGPTTIVRDTASGFDWLRPGVVDGLSYNDVLRATAPGGELAGFRIASFEDVHCTLINPNLGLVPCRPLAYDRVDYGLAVSFRALFGTGARYEPIAPIAPGEREQSWAAAVYAYEDLSADVDSQIVPLPRELPTRFFLVRPGPNTVPAPASGVLLVIGAAALMAGRRPRR